MTSIFKKIILFFTIISFCLFISNYALANDGATDSMKNGINDVRNAVGGAENVMENAAKGTTTTVKDGLSNMGNGIQNTMQNANYSVSRTANGDTTGTGSGMFGTNNTVWTWFIVGIVTLIIVGVIWYITTRNKNESNH